jgi:hypothetical protein
MDPNANERIGLRRAGQPAVEDVIEFQCNRALALWTATGSVHATRGFYRPQRTKCWVCPLPRNLPTGRSGRAPIGPAFRGICTFSHVFSRTTSSCTLPRSATPSVGPNGQEADGRREGCAGGNPSGNRSGRGLALRSSSSCLAACDCGPIVLRSRAVVGRRREYGTALGAAISGTWVRWTARHRARRSSPFSRP